MLWDEWPSTYFGMLKKDGKPGSGGLSVGGEREDSDNEHVVRSMMRADNYWLFCHKREILVHMANDIIEKLLNLYLIMVDEFVRGGGPAHAQGGRRERMGLAVQGGLRGIWVPFST